MNERRLEGMAGFTLVELLAVIAIIVLLAAGLVVSVGYFAKRGTATRTSSILMLVEQGIISFHDDFNIYPPEYWDSINSWSFRNDPNLASADNPFHRDEANWYSDFNFDINDDFDYSSEILYFFLIGRYDKNHPLYDKSDPDFDKYLPRKSAYLELPEYAVKDTDEDGYMEIVDAWGNPLLYVAKDLYGDDPINESQNVGGNVEPHDDKNENSFSLYSYGIDGLGFYAATKAGEVDYPVQHKSISDDTGMMKEISDKYGTGGVGVKKANRDDVINWKEY